MDEQKICPHCRRSNRATARYCGGCGHDFGVSAPTATDGASAAPGAQKPAASPLTSAPPPVQPAVKEFCPVCGKETVPGARFCRYCGGDLSAPSTFPAPAATVSPPPAAAPVPDKTVTRPEPMPSSPPVQTPAGQSRPAPPKAQRRGLPGWLWLITGLVIGLLLGAGGALAYPHLMELQATDDDGPTPALEEIAPTAAATPAPAPTEETPAESALTVELPTPTPQNAPDAGNSEGNAPLTAPEGAPVAPDDTEEDAGATP